MDHTVFHKWLIKQTNLVVLTLAVTVRGHIRILQPTLNFDEVVQNEFDGFVNSMPFVVLDAGVENKEQVGEARVRVDVALVRVLLLFLMIV